MAASPVNPVAAGAGPRDELAPRRWLIHAGIVLLVGAIYGFTLPYPFLFDDLPYLVDNPLMRDTRSFLFFTEFDSFLLRSLRLGLPHDLSVNFILRPVTYATFHLNYLLDGYNPFWYRAFNLVIHAANGVLVFEILFAILGRPFRGRWLANSSRRFITLTATAVYVAHPLHTESVTYIVQRFTSFGTFFYLLTLWSYVRAILDPDPARAKRWRVFSVAVLLVGMFSKEILFTAPFLLLGLDWFLFGTPFKVALRRITPHACLLPILPALLLYISYIQQGGKLGVGGFLNVALHGGEEVSAYSYAVTQLTILIRYLGMVVLPAGLNVDPDPPVFTSLADAPALLALVFHAALWAGAVWLWRRRPADHRVALALGGLVWFYVTISIDSSIVPLPDVMADHRTYQPMIGLVLALAAGLDALRTGSIVRPWGRVVVPRLVVAWALALSAATVVRNYVWSSGITLWEDAAAKSPRKARPWTNLGTDHIHAGRTNEAIACYQQAINFGPDFVLPYQNLQATFFQLGQYQEVIELGKQAERNCPVSVYGYLILANAGAAHLMLGNVPEAVRWLEAAVNRFSMHGETQAGLGDAYRAAGRLEEALQRYQFALELSPNLRTNSIFQANLQVTQEAVRARAKAP